MTTYRLEPLSSLFFNNGQPMGFEDAGQMEVATSFPPPPRTVAGALRAAFAKSADWSDSERWSGISSWNDDVKAVLGDGNCLNDLQFFGPYVFHETCGLLFPCPMHLAGFKEGDRVIELDWLMPQPVPKFSSDLGEVRFAAAIPNDKNKLPEALESFWITQHGLEQVLKGCLPEITTLIPAKKIWQKEVHVGNRRNRESHTTDEDALFRKQHARLGKGIRLLEQVTGLGKSLTPFSPIPLGGEGGFSWLGESQKPIDLPVAPSFVLNGTVRYTLTLITPAIFSTDDCYWKKIEKPFTHKKPDQEARSIGTVISACTHRPQLIGGWQNNNSPAAEFATPKQLVLAAGSTWFMETDISTFSAEFLHLSHIGEQTNWGYGQVALGKWRS